MFAFVPGDYGRSYFTSIAAAAATAAAAAADVVVSGYKSHNRLGSSRYGFPLTQISSFSFLILSKNTIVVISKRSYKSKLHTNAHYSQRLTLSFSFSFFLSSHWLCDNYHII